jgi:hypothetical protein
VPFFASGALLARPDARSTPAFVPIGSRESHSRVLNFSADAQIAVITPAHYLEFCTMTHLATSVFCELLILAAAPAGIDFDGEQYLPGFSSNQPGLRLVEYVRAGETVENWTKLFAVRNFPEQRDPREAVKAFERVVKQHNPLAGVQVLVKEDGSEAMIDFLTWETGADQMEFNVHRYQKKPGYPGLISYQFAYRFRVTPELTAEKVRRLKDHWSEQLRNLDPPVAFGD